MSTKESNWRISIRKVGMFFSGIKFLPTLEYIGATVTSIASIVEGILVKPTGFDIFLLIIKWVVIGLFAGTIPYLISKAIGFSLVWVSNFQPMPIKANVKIPHLFRKSSPIVYKAVIVPNKNMWGQEMATYAGIRIDSEESCQGVKAKLKSIVRIRNNGDREPLNLDEINPTNQYLRWSERVKCMLEIVDDSNKEPRLLFQSYRDYKINTGTYELCFEILKPDSKPVEIKETLEIKKPYSTVKMKWL